ncbi:MAG: GGDEF domain-containing protein [Cryobacterium sp.]|nr:GGDEF domain-containing protein [Oligoflexia bacterium]
MAVFDDLPPPGSDDTDGSDSTKVLSSDQATMNQELAKAKEQEACLIIIRGTPQGHRFFITQDEMVLGRDPTADISILDQSISRRHAKVTKSGGKVLITDLGSANGSLINDKKLAPDAPRPLAKEDMIKLGNTVMKFLPQGELETLYMGNLGSAAHTDALTKLYNKRYLLEVLEVEFKRAKALHTDFALLFFDLDHFKKVNDTYGHDAGDHVLREFAALVRANHIRPKDVFARYGGEEFVLLLANTGIKDASDIAERIRGAVETHAFIYEGKRLSVTTSMGVAELTTGIESANSLLKHADQALYAAKGAGRNQVVIADAP